MGLISAAKGAIQDLAADSWREYFYCERMDDDTLMVKGEKKISGKSSNKKGTDNIISNGSIIAVNEGQCMLIVDQGGITEVCAEAGEYIYDSSAEPSIFYGSLGENIKKYWDAFYKRWSMGGDAARDQRVYFVNIRPIINNKFGTQQPIQYRFVPDEITGTKITFHVRCNGFFTFSVADPIVFYKKLANNVEDVYERSMVYERLRTSLVTALNPALGNLASKGYHYAELTNASLAIGEEVQQVIQDKWLNEFGIAFGSIDLQSTSLPPDEQAKLDKFEEDRYYASDAFMNQRDQFSQMMDVMKTGAGNENGAFNGMFGLHMMGNTMNQMGMNPGAMMGGMMPQNGMMPNNGMANNGMMPNNGMQNGMMQNNGMMQGGMMPNNGMQNGMMSNTGMVGVAVQTPQAPAADGWKCACGETNTTNFCAKCGAKKPDPVVEEGWTCTCGAVNKGKFCPDCGAKKPAGAPLYRCDKCGWEPEDPKNPPKFCPECGDPFTDGDIQ